jgi:hypothetical protein
MSRFLADIARRGAGLMPVMAPRTPSTFESRRHGAAEAGDTPQAGDTASDAVAVEHSTQDAMIPATRDSPSNERTSGSSGPLAQVPVRSSNADAAELPNGPIEASRVVEYGPPASAANARPSAGVSLSAPSVPPAEEVPAERTNEADGRRVKTEGASAVEASPRTTRFSVDHLPKPDRQPAARSLEPSITPLPQPVPPKPAAPSTQGAQSGAADRSPETQPIRVTIGRVDIRASAPPPSPAPPRRKSGSGFADLRLSRAYLDRNHG